MLDRGTRLSWPRVENRRAQLILITVLIVDGSLPLGPGLRERLPVALVDERTLE